MEQKTLSTTLQVGDTDLVGNKFNGHDLHLYLEQAGIHSIHCVTRKQSDDFNTIEMPIGNSENFARWILNSEYFATSDIVHLHLIHNTNFDINLLPMMSQLKPIVITLHDTYFLGGHCIYAGACEKWQTQCFDCPFPNTPFAISTDTSAIDYFQKKTAFNNSNISVIVASEWMEKKVNASPIFHGKKVYRIPFGIDQTLFCPKGLPLAKRELNIPEENLVLMFRADQNPFKGLDIIENALSNLQLNTPITLLTVGQADLLSKFAENYDIRDYGWLTDDTELAKLYQACDLFLMPSKREAFGMMAIEAMSCGKVVLSTTGTSLEGVIHSPACGIAVAEEDFQSTLHSLLSDPKKRSDLETASLEYARNHYSSKDYMEAIQRTYKEVLKEFIPAEHAGIILNSLQNNSRLEESITIEAPEKKTLYWYLSAFFRILHSWITPDKNVV